MYVCMYLSIYVTHTHTHTHMYIHIYKFKPHPVPLDGVNEIVGRRVAVDPNRRGQNPVLGQNRLSNKKG